MATTDPSDASPCDRAVGAPSSLTEPSALASQRLTVDDPALESAGNAAAPGSVAAAAGTVVVVAGIVVVVGFGFVVVGVGFVVVVVLRDTRRSVVGTVLPRRLWFLGTVVGLDEGVDDEGLAVDVDGTEVVDNADVVGTVVVVDEVEDVEELVEEVEDDFPVCASAERTICALAANGARTASIAAAALVSPIVALSDQTTVRASFWTI